MTTREEFLAQIVEMNAGLKKFQELAAYKMIVDTMEVNYEQIIKDRDNNKLSYERLVHEYRFDKPKAKVFDFLMTTIMENAHLRDQWTDLLMGLKLINGDVEKQIADVINNAAPTRV